jgi:soluble epoxide hydrolase/lipid-phosphate phosphatase
MGWRYQIPALVDMGFRVVAPDMMGYGSTVSVISITLKPPVPDSLVGMGAVLSRRSDCLSDHGHLLEFTAFLSHLLIEAQDAPEVPPNPINLYGIKSASDAIAALAKELNAPQIILGGHDW